MPKKKVEEVQKQEEVKTQATAAEQAEAVVEQPKKFELTKEELEALLRKKEEATRQNIALAEAKAAAKKQLDEEAEKAKGAVLSDVSTRSLLNKEQKYKVVVYPAEGEQQGGRGVININGVKFKFKYGEEVVLPESALDILKNSKTFGEPKVVRDSDGSHYEPVKVQKRAFNAIPANSNKTMVME